MTSVILVGVVFGAYLIRFSQTVPLAVYLGYVTWAAGSMGTGALVHVLHYGTAIVALHGVRRTGLAEVEVLAEASVPGEAVAASGALALL